MLVLLAALIGCGAASADVVLPAHQFPGAYQRLSETGLYADLAAKAISPRLEAFTPRYRLWSDGAVKRRWIGLPPGSKIDTSDADHWQFPVGTQLFKEFAAPDGRLAETRLVERIADTGDPARDYWMGSFAWLDDESDAVFVPKGQQDLRGTDLDAPSADACHTCHNGEPGRILGFSALQLAGTGPEGLRLAGLVDRITAPVDPPVVPGDPATMAALGYLHANCGHCHNPNGAARPDTDLDLRVRATDRELGATGAFRTAVGQPLFRFKADGVVFRVAPGEPDSSGIAYRMSRRGPRLGMPPIESEHVDDAGVAAVEAWIAALPR